ncbi:B3 domain-containing protein LOC_Os12g40080-like [Lolium rigidum]|uniref:B3 domain-containing protein LOC_Os12g40080-like n=1 Tax=Lolium rigidum TaxID=89674 RepID=UPI001F5D9801|nr:B3 domain-containing protein LOC_Os12g40080-like [Lolium rigidum]
MALDQGHDQDNRTDHNISSKSCQRCEGCDAHYYWCHLDNTQKFFFKIMVGDFQEKMIIPDKFVKNFKGQISKVIKLEAPDGNKYDVQATRDLNKIVLGSGWATFATFYELKEGCVLVFRYIGDSHFRVLIFDYPSCCEKEVFHVVINYGSNDQEKDIRFDQSLVSKTRCRNDGSGKDESHQRCGHCDVHFYWHHMDDREKHFVRFMIGNFRRQMSIPEKFVKNFRGQISEVIKLEAPDGNIYDIQVTKGLNKIVLGSGWAAFSNAYELKEHDVLVFRYIGDSHFKTLIFDPSGCEKELFRVVMKRAPNVQEIGISDDQSFPEETMPREKLSHDDYCRNTNKMTSMDSPSPRSDEHVTCTEDPQETMNSGSLQEITKPHYVLATGCNLTAMQQTEVDVLVKKIRPVIPFYITTMNKTSLSGSLAFCKDYAVTYLPHEDQFITLCHPQKSSIWVDNLKVITDGASMLSAGWLCFVHHNELRESDICVFEVSKSDGEVTMVVHSLEGGHCLPGKNPVSQSFIVKDEVTEEEERDDEHTESEYYYSRFAKFLTDEEQEDIFGSASIQLGNPVYVAVMQKNHVSGRNFLIIPSKFAAKHLAERSHDILLVRPNRKGWCVKYYYQERYTRGGFTCTRWNKFIRDNKLRKGDVCVFELLKGMSKVTMMVHVSRKVDGRFVLVG